MFKSSPRNLLPIVAAYLPPEGGPGDMFLRGTALTPPLFLPLVLLVGAAVAREDGPAGTPLALNGALAAIHLGLSGALLFNAVPRLLGRGAGRREAAAQSSAS